MTESFNKNSDSAFTPFLPKQKTLVAAKLTADNFNNILVGMLTESYTVVSFSVEPRSITMKCEDGDVIFNMGDWIVSEWCGMGMTYRHATDEERQEYGLQ